MKAGLEYNQPLVTSSLMSIVCTYSPGNFNFSWYLSLEHTDLDHQGLAMSTPFVNIRNSSLLSCVSTFSWVPLIATSFLHLTCYVLGTAVF